MESKFGQMVQNMKESGRTIKLMEKEHFGMQMVIFMKVNGLTIKHKEKACTHILTELNIRDNG